MLEEDERENVCFTANGQTAYFEHGLGTNDTSLRNWLFAGKHFDGFVLK